MLNHPIKRAFAAITSLTLTFLSVIFVSTAASVTPASAATSTAPPVIDNPANAVTADALPTAQINGVAWDQVIVGNTVYVAGQFTSARPAGSALGSNESARYNLMSYNLSTGVMTSWAPNVNGRIRVITASPDGSRIYIGGSFTQVNGVTRSRIAAFNTTDGSLIDSFKPAVGSDVFAVAATNNLVYMGGWFTAVNNTPRTRLAAVNASNGALTAWAPSSDHTIWGMGLTTAADRVVVAGSFTTLNNAPATSLGSISASDGTSYPFVANQIIHNTGDSAAMMTMKVVDNKAYAGAYWYGGTGNFEGGLIADAYDGTVLNLANCLGDTYDFAPMNGVAYMVSHHHQCTDINGFTEEVPRIWQHSDAVTIEPTGLVQNNSYGYPNFGGNPSGSYVNWFPKMTVGAASGMEQAGWTVESSGSYLAVGGEFPTVNGTAQQGLVRFTTRANGAPKKVGPAATGTSITPSVRNISATTARVRFRTDFDRDGMDLTYVMKRRLNGSQSLGTIVNTTTAKSTFWNRPYLQFVDSGLTSGTSYQYRLTVIDADGNERLSNWTTITAGANVPVANAYSDQVFADGVANYWRFDDPSGSTSVTDWANGDDLAAPASGLTLGTSGAVIGSSDASGTFSGADLATAVSGQTQTGPDTYTSEVWFRTTTTSGGKILGFGDGVSGASSNYDRHIYMSNDGRLTYGVYLNGTYTLTSAKSYNDGAWHQAVASLSSAGMVFYVDGIRVGKNSSLTSGQPFSGRWKIGGDNLDGWGNTGSSRYFAGDIDDVAIYPIALSQAQVRDHYVKSGRTVDLPPVPTDAYGLAVTGDSPTLYWRLAEASGTTASDASGNLVDGTYYNSPTQGAPSSVVSGNSAVGFDGSDDLVSSNQAFANPTVLSVESWFNTTSTGGGKIVGFGTERSGNSGGYDRHIYMNSAGQLRFGAYTGALNIAGTSASYNDGAWHHVVGTLGSNGMQLFVDGVLVATNPNTGAQDYTGYWRVGGDNTWEGNNYFQGTIDEVAVYDHVLTGAQVRAHYKASPAAVNLPPTASFKITRNGLSPKFTATAEDADGSVASYQWSFGDGGSSSTQSPTHSYGAAGTYNVELTVTDNSGATVLVQQSVIVRATLPAPSDTYGSVVSGDDPLLFWRLDEASGSTALDNTANVYDGSYAGDVSHGGSTAVTGGGHSVGLEANEFVSSNESFYNPMTFSLETWFSSSQSGGRIFGFGNAQSGESNNYDRQIYLDSGNLVFGTWHDGAYTVNTSGVNYADGGWHHVVATFGPGGMVLYVDGVAQASRADWLAQEYGGYWRVGDDSFWASGDFTGSIDEAAVYDHVLSAAQVANHFAAGTSGTANVKPVAKFEASPSGLTAAVDGSESSDSDGSIVSYAWDFGDGGSGSGVTASHTYAAAGSYQVQLTVTDDDGATDSVTKSVSVSAPNVKPVAKFEASPSGLTAAVDGSESSDSDGSIVSYAWDFGDGGSGSGVTASHTYAAAGSYQVQLTVTDDDGATDSVTKSVSVSAPNVKPVAKFEASPSGLTAAVNGSESSDSDGSIVSYAWDFGDGGSGSGVTASHTYAAAGSYQVQLTVTDDDGATDSVTKSVSVSAPVVPGAAVDAFERSVASGWGAADVGGAWTVSTPSSFSVDGSAGVVRLAAAGATRTATLASVAVADVSVVTDFAVDKVPVGGHFYQQVLARVSGSSSYMLTARLETTGVLRVYVSKVVSGTETVLKTTTVSGFNYVAGEKLKVRFDVVGSGSAALAGKVWRAGEAEPGAATVSVTDSTASLQSAGAVGLRFYAGGGMTSLPLTIKLADYNADAPSTANVKPVAKFEASPSGLTAAVDGSESSDSDGSIVSYAWDFGDGGSGSGVTASHTYAAAGSYQVQLTVTDDDGATDSVTKSVSVSAPVVPGAAVDAFERSVASGWGAADVGGAWTVSTPSSFSVDGSAGVVRLAAAGATRTATLASVAVADVSVVTDFAVDKVPVGGHFYQQVLARVSGSSSYMLTARLETTGVLRVYVSKVVSGTETVLKTTTVSGFNYVAGEKLKVRFDVVGSGSAALAGKVWRAGEAEPGAATVSVTDSTASLQSAGAVGLRFYAGGGMTSLPLTIKLADYSAEAK